MTILKEQLQAMRERRAYALVTIVDTQGSLPRSYGKMMVFPDASLKGTIGGGIIEYQAIQDALKTLAERRNKITEYQLIDEFAEGKNVSKGSMRVFIEYVHPKPLLVICGGGHIACALLEAADLAGFDTLLFEKSDTSLINQTVKRSHNVISVSTYENEMRSTSIEAGAYYVVATSSHRYDVDALSAIRDKKAAYIGVLACKEKIPVLFRQLKEIGFSEEELACINTPIGLNIGGETPGEIAIAIMAEILSIRSKVECIQSRKDDYNRNLADDVS